MMGTYLYNKKGSIYCFYLETLGKIFTQTSPFPSYIP